MSCYSIPKDFALVSALVLATSPTLSLIANYLPRFDIIPCLDPSVTSTVTCWLVAPPNLLAYIALLPMFPDTSGGRNHVNDIEKYD